MHRSEHGQWVGCIGWAMLPAEERDVEEYGSGSEILCDRDMSTFCWLHSKDVQRILRWVCWLLALAFQSQHGLVLTAAPTFV
jgi:hypothetical protein